jgi:hypothetical protein
MDTWRIEEALMHVRDGVDLTPDQAARRDAEMIVQRERSDVRRAMASALLAIARRLDPEAERDAVAAHAVMLPGR